MLRRGIFWGAAFVLALAGSARAQTAPTAEEKPSIEELLRRIDALQHRVEELEAEKHPGKSAGRPSDRSSAANAHRGQTAPVTSQEPPPAISATTKPSSPAIIAGAPQPATGPVQGLLPPEPMGHANEMGEGDDALRSDLPGLAMRIPGTQSEVRVYGFANVNAYRDFNGRNQTDAPAAQTIPLAGSPADSRAAISACLRGSAASAMDTRTVTAWGTLETRVEGDFGGGAPASTNAVFRLRQALGRDRYRAISRAGRPGEQPVERRRI